MSAVLFLDARKHLSHGVRNVMYSFCGSVCAGHASFIKNGLSRIGNSSQKQLACRAELRRGKVYPYVRSLCVSGQAESKLQQCLPKLLGESFCKVSSSCKAHRSLGCSANPHGIS